LYKQYLIPLNAEQPTLFIIDADNGNIINPMAHSNIADIYQVSQANGHQANLNESEKDSLDDFPWYMNDEGVCLDWKKYEINKNELFYHL